MAAALPFIAVGLQVFGAISSAGAASQQGQAQAQAAQYNQQVAQRNAQIAQDQAAAEADQQSRQARAQIGLTRANYGASGVTAEGSPLDVLALSASNAELDRQNILYRGTLRAQGYTDTANLDGMAKTNAQAAGSTGAGSALLLGLTKAGANASGLFGSSSGYTSTNIGGADGLAGLG